MIIKSVKIENILSIGNVSLEFGDSGLVLVEGWNYDSNRATGAGKTAIFNSICYCLYGKMPRKITASEILRRGTKKGYVTVVVESGADSYEITRSRPTGLLIKKNGVEVTLTQESLEGALGINFGQFLMSMYTAQSEGKSLIELNDSSKKDFFLQLLDLNQFTNYYVKSDLKVKEAELLINEVDKKILVANTQIDTLSRSVGDVEALTEELNKIDLSSIQQAIDASMIEEPDLSAIDDLLGKANFKLRQLQDSLRSNELTQNKIDRLRTQISQIQARKDSMSSIVCPSCNSEIVVGKDVSLRGTIEKQFDQAIAALQDEIGALRSSLVDMSHIPVECNKVEQLIHKLTASKTAKLHQYKKDLNAREQLKNELFARKNKRNYIQQAIDQQQHILDRINQYKTALDKLSLERDQLAQNKIKWATVQSIFAPTGAPAYLLDGIIEQFNTFVQEYVDMIWDDASYSISSQKENKDKSVVAKFSDVLTIDGESASMGSLSGGEFRCLSIATNFAVIDLISTLTGKLLNPIILDESFIGLDAAGREQVLTLLQKASQKREIWVIDHATEMKSAFSRVVKITKQDKVSAIHDIV